jgi:hypothetical protein
MWDERGERRTGGGRGWMVLAGAGAAAVGWYLGRAAGKSRKRPAGAVGAHAWLVPTGQARTEARLTRQALVYASESKHG